MKTTVNTKKESVLPTTGKHKKFSTVFKALIGIGIAASVASATAIKDYAAYQKAVAAARDMFQDQTTNDLVSKYGLDLLSVTWEDTGRYKDSSVGPNISDMSIQVHTVDQEGNIKPEVMPVIRYANFTDKTADVEIDKIVLLVGNEKGEKLKAITLNEYLANFDQYLSNPKSHVAKEKSLLSPRDTHVLISPQISFLPVPANGVATFNPVLFNYQSSEGDPAVLAILATPEGTSATIIDNTRDAFEEHGTWGQRLFFNKDGQRASLTGTRASDVAAQATSDATSNDKPSSAANGQGGANMVMLIQVPLKYKNQNPMFPVMEDLATSMTLESASRGIEDAVIGHGDIEGPFTEVDGVEIERDHRFPVRVTIQFYKATDVASVDESTIKEIKTKIDKVFKNADYVGSLVTEGTTLRPTEHNVTCEQPIWWDRVWPMQLSNGETITKEIAEDYITNTVISPDLYPRWYWCGFYSQPDPTSFFYALEMDRTKDFKVKEDPKDEN